MFKKYIVLKQLNFRQNGQVDSRKNPTNLADNHKKISCGNTTEAKPAMNGPLLCLHKWYVCCTDLISKMSTIAGYSITQKYIRMGKY